VVLDNHSYLILNGFIKGGIMQTNKQTLIESFANTLSGYIINIGIQFIIWPIFGISISLGENMLIGLVFLFISVFRNFVVRRIFSRL